MTPYNTTDWCSIKSWELWFFLKSPIALNTYVKPLNFSVVGVAPLLNKATPWIPTQRSSSYSWGCKIHFPPKLYENYHHNYHTSATLILQLESQTPKTSNDGFPRNKKVVWYGRTIHIFHLNMTIFSTTIQSEVIFGSVILFSNPEQVGRHLKESSAIHGQRQYCIFFSPNMMKK